MGILIAVVIGLLLAACYAPRLRDCTVICDATSDCASGQVCGPDHLCATPDVAGRCADQGRGMADATPVDATPVDATSADARPDAPTTVKLRVEVMGKGSVVVDGRGTCSSREPQDGKCTYDIAPGVLQRASAIAIESDHVFLGWGTEPCSGQPAICTFTASAATTVVAKFGHSK